MTKSQRILALTASAVLIAASCGGSSESSDSSASASSPATDPPATDPPATDPPATDPPATDPPATDPPATDPPATDPPVTDPPAPPLPDTPVVATLNRVYAFDGSEPDFSLLPALPEEVEAHWFTSGDVLAVVFVGLPVDVDACPGNSIQTATGFEFVSNAPMPAGACGDFPTAIDNTASQGVQICGDRVGYLSLIPTGTAGTLFSSLERPDPDIGGVGITGFAELPDPSVLPEIALDQLAC